MKDIRKNIVTLALVILGLLVLGLSSCFIEKRLGKEFRENWSDTTVIVLPPGYIFKENLKDYEIAGIDSIPEYERDSILLSNSLFLKEVSDSVVITDFTERFKERLGKYGFNVMDESSMDEFMSEHPNGILLNIAQISLEEFVHPYSFDYDLGDEMLTVTDIDLNAFSFNIWLEISQLNSSEKNRVFFTSDFIFDELEGYFRQYIFSGEINFEYTIDTISVSEIYSFTEGLGEKYADYLFDYFLNEYIQEEVPRNFPNAIKPLHWDPDTRVFIFKNEESRFIELED